LLDTDVFSYLMRPEDARAKIYLPHTQHKLLAVCFVTVGELLFGASKRGWGKRRVADLHKRLRSVVVVPYDYKMCAVYGDLKARLTQAGIGVTDNDLWIAACAVRHSIPLISNNRRHFENIPDLVLISEAPVLAEIKSQGTLPLVAEKDPNASSES